ADVDHGDVIAAAVGHDQLGRLDDGEVVVLVEEAVAADEQGVIVDRQGLVAVVSEGDDALEPAGVVDGGRVDGDPVAGGVQEQVVSGVGDAGAGRGVGDGVGALHELAIGDLQQGGAGVLGGAVAGCDVSDRGGDAGGEHLTV